MRGIPALHNGVKVHEQPDETIVLKLRITHGNRFLDRAAVVATMTTPGVAFFGNR